jgi:hypothetical protein
MIHLLNELQYLPTGVAMKPPSAPTTKPQATAKSAAEGAPTETTTQTATIAATVAISVVKVTGPGISEAGRTEAGAETNPSSRHRA